ncbi:hypothetical protein TNCV_1677921 [Trichonephila clavipes]|nr:hypothetical protein TNCV_1677921 [Trichonephila clavipes]
MAELLNECITFNFLMDESQTFLHRRLCEARSFYVTRYDAGRQKAVLSPSLEESILNVVADRAELSTTAVAHYARHHRRLYPVDWAKKKIHGRENKQFKKTPTQSGRYDVSPKHERSIKAVRRLVRKEKAVGRKRNYRGNRSFG